MRVGLRQGSFGGIDCQDTAELELSRLEEMCV